MGFEIVGKLGFNFG